MLRIFHQFRLRWVRLALGALIVGLFTLHAAKIWTIPGVEVVERNLYDARMRGTMPGGVDDRVVILDIDEKSLAEYGRWPWNRSRMARITQTLFDQYGIAALGFDVVWAEPETEQLQSLLSDTGAAGLAPQLLSQIDTDRAFANSLNGRLAALGYYFSNEPNAPTKNVLPQPVLSTKELPARVSVAADWRGYTGNIRELMDSGIAAGHTNSLRDPDGIIRRVPLLIRHGDGYYETLSLAVMRQLFGGEPIKPVIVSSGAYNRVEALQVGPLRLPVDGEIAALVSFRGPSHSFPYISLGDVLAGRVPAEDLMGKIVLIGTSAPGLGDNRATATDEVMPGVEVHANMIAAMLDQHIREQPDFVTGLDVAQVAGIGLLAVLIMTFASPALGLAIYALFSGLAIWLNLTAWNQSNLVLPLAAVLLMLLAVYTFFSVWGFFVEGRAKRQLGNMFGQYVPPRLVAEMAKDPANYSMESRDAELTVLFSDLRGFTGISEQLSAKQLAAYINEYLSRMSAVIAAHNGTLDKFIGDAIMAFWGAPVDDPQAAANATRAALEMQVEADRLSAEFVAAGLPEFRIGIGLNSGPMRVGDMGSKLRRAYTVMGDAVNLGSRLEGITKNYGVGIIIGETTRAMLPEFTCRLLDRVRVKGKEQAIEIFEPIGETSALSTVVLQEVACWNAMMQAYFAQSWDDAEKLLQQARSQGAAEHYTSIYAERIAYWRANPPTAGWDGVTTFTTK